MFNLFGLFGGSKKKSKKSKPKKAGGNLYQVERSNTQRLESMSDLPSYLRK